MPLRRLTSYRAKLLKERSTSASFPSGLSPTSATLVALDSSKVWTKTAGTKKSCQSGISRLLVRSKERTLRVIIQNSAEEVAVRAAKIIADLIRRKPNCVLGLATGSTPLGTYSELIRLHREEGLDFSGVTTFNLDEYVGLGPGHPQSYRYFMQKNLFEHINIDPSRTFVPDGRALDFEAHCRQYEQRIRDAGGIDLQVLGIGSDGHIAFNEPGSSLGSRTRLKTLTSKTVQDNARFFGSEDQVPRLAVTMGVGTILESSRCLLLAIGSSKAAAIRSTVEGPVTAQVTASALQLHRDVIVIVDEEAASWLARRDYYEEVEAAQQLLETGQLRALGIGVN